MKLDHGRWPFSMVQLSWSDFCKKSIYKAFGPFTRCHPNVDQEEWPCTKKWMCWYLLLCAQKWQFRTNLKFDHSLVFIFSSPKTSFLTNLLEQHLFAMGPCLFLPEHLICLYHHKTHRTMSVDNVGLTICLLETSNSIITRTFFPWFKVKWSQDEFNIQSQFYKVLGRLRSPWCKQSPSLHTNQSSLRNSCSSKLQEKYWST
jgi:hypothetical protein